MATVAPGRRRAGHRDLTSGSIPKTMMAVAWPQMITGGLMSVDQLIDLVWAGILGPLALASVGVAQSWIQVAQGLRGGLDTANRAVIARAVGAGDMKLASYLTSQAFTLGGLFALVITGFGLIGTRFLLSILGVSEQLMDEATLYMQLQWVAQLSFALQSMTAAASQASGDTVTPMRGQMIARGIKV